MCIQPHQCVWQVAGWLEGLHRCQYQPCVCGQGAADDCSICMQLSDQPVRILPSETCTGQAHRVSRVRPVCVCVCASFSVQPQLTFCKLQQQLHSAAQWTPSFILAFMIAQELSTVAAVAQPAAQTHVQTGAGSIASPGMHRPRLWCRHHDDQLISMLRGLLRPTSQVH